MNKERPFFPVFLIVILVLFFSTPLYSQNHQEIKKVLVLLPLYDSRDWDFNFMTGFFSTLNQNERLEISVSFEYLRTGLIPQKISVEETINNLKKINEYLNPDLIISVFPSVHLFLKEHGEEIFPGITKIFVPTTEEQIDVISKIPDSYIIKSYSEYTMRTTLTNFETILPNLNNLIVLCGSGDDDLYYLNIFRRTIKEINFKADLTYHIGVPLPELVPKLSNLPENTAVFFISMIEDDNGNTYVTRNLFPILSDTANAPIFSFQATPFSLGIAGGVMTRAEVYGNYAAEASINILFNAAEGQEMNTIKTGGQYDWRVLRRFNINENNLPDGSEVLFKTETFYERYRRQIILVFILIILESFFLVILFLNLKKRHHVEKLLKHNQDLLDRSQETAKVGGWDLDLISDKMSYTKEIFDILELNPASPLSKEMARGFYHPDDLEIFDKAIKNAIDFATPFDIEIRIITANGKIIWVNSKCEVIKNNGKIIHLSGTIQDITIRKKAELELHNSLEEKDILLKEVHHRVKNNLSIMSSLIALQMDTIIDEDVKDILLSSQNRIRAMALIHEQIYNEKNIQTLNFANYIKQLVDTIIYSYLLDGAAVKTKFDIIEQQVDLNTIVPLGIIINEIISNSVKHAFTDIANPKIEVSLKKVMDDKLILSLTDNGTGLPEDSVISQKNTIGFLLIHNLITQINGQLEITRKNGTGFFITFPDVN